VHAQVTGAHHAAITHRVPPYTSKVLVYLFCLTTMSQLLRL